MVSSKLQVESNAVLGSPATVLAYRPEFNNRLEPVSNG